MFCMSLVYKFHFILQNRQSATDWKFTKVKTKQKNAGLSFTEFANHLGGRIQGTKSGERGLDTAGQML